jgi:hypothetical protein
VFTFLAGVSYLSRLEPTRVEMTLALLLLACFALLCTAIGQLAVVIERLGRHRDRTNASPCSGSA